MSTAQTVISVAALPIRIYSTCITHWKYIDHDCSTIFYIALSYAGLYDGYIFFYMGHISFHRLTSRPFVDIHHHHHIKRREALSRHLLWTIKVHAGHTFRWIWRHILPTLSSSYYAT